MSVLLHPINQKTSLAKKLLAAGALVAIAVASLITPQQAAHAVGRFVGNLTVDCDGTSLDGQVVVYLELGDTFSVVNEDDDANCLISDPNNILTGEDVNHSGLGSGVVEYEEYSNDITIDAPGTFTINEDDGDTSNIKTFHVKQGFVFGNDDGDIGDDSGVGDSYVYNEVGLNSDGSPIAATVTVTAVSNLYEFNVDRNDRPDTDAGIGNGIEKDSLEPPAYAEYSVSFHAPGNPNSPIVISDMTVTVKDIDSLQWVAVTGASSYLLSSTPATNLVGRTEGNVLYVEELNDISSSTEDEDHWAVINFTSKSAISIRVGNSSTDPDEDVASFNILFADVEWETTPTVINLASTSGLADTGVSGSGVNGTLVIAGLLTAAGIATTIARRRRAII
jgi:hypothetical protein